MAHGHSGLTPQEARIMDLFDSGLSCARIADRLGMRRKNVDRVVTYYHGAAEHRLERRAMSATSTDLLAAIQRERAA